MAGKAQARTFVSICAAILPAPLAAADMRADVVAAIISDDNLFRLPVTMRAAVPHRGRDAARSAGGGLSIASKRGPLTLNGHADVRKTWFAYNDGLDNSGFDIGGTGAYAAGNGSLQVDASIVRRLTRFEDVRSITRALQTLASANARASRSILGNFRLTGSVRIYRNTNSSPIVAVNDYRRVGYTAGFGYYSPSGNILAVEGRAETSRGLNDRVTLIAGLPAIYRASFSERAVEARLLYSPSVIWKVEGTGGYTRHNDRSGVAKDFAGPTGDLTVSWSPRATILAELMASRSFQTSSAVFSNGVRVSRIGLDVTGQMTGTIALRLNAERRWRTFRYDLEAAMPLVGRRERIDDAGVELDYAPSPRWTLALTAGRSRRESTLAQYRYDSNQAGLSATFAFGPGAISNRR